ncbi:MAG: 5-oxoprolinase subunit PxpB [Planctomycetota bacterium]|nr:5-oxoprolinase subunit PxpB [Planctomycetota bacterium]
MGDAPFSVETLGDQAMLVRFASESTRKCFDRIRYFEQAVKRLSISGVIELVPAYTSLAVYYNPLVIAEFELRQRLLKITLTESITGDAVGADSETIEASSSREIIVPVCYDREFGEDLAYVAQVHGLTIEEVVAIHTSACYFVHMIGFLPGFPYLGGLSHRIATPRKESPRTFIAAGSVGIAGTQTGVYPIDSPGGWQIIGRSPWQFFDPSAATPCRIQAGDTVKFNAITRNEFGIIHKQCMVRNGS